MREEEEKNHPPQNNKMASSRAGAWAPPACLTPSVSGRASERAGCLAGWRRDGVEEEGGGAIDWDWDFFGGGGGQGMQAASPAGSPVTANDAEPEEAEGGGGL